MLYIRLVFQVNWKADSSSEMRLTDVVAQLLPLRWNRLQMLKIRTSASSRKLKQSSEHKV